VDAQDSAREVIERALARPVSEVTHATWGFTNRTDIVTLDSGERVVVQRYRRRADAEYRLRVTRGLRESTAGAGIRLPQVREFNLDDDPAWVVYEMLPGVPVPEAGEAGPGGARFPQLARAMGELLAAFRRLPYAGLELDESWANPERLASSAANWADQVGIEGADQCIAEIPGLFAGRPVVLAHGDFAPVNVLTDGTAVTGLLDFEAVRLADPLFDAAWWAWSVSFASADVLDAAWPAFLDAAGIDPAEPRFADRIRALQVARMLEQLATGILVPDVARIVTDRLHATVS
jgi:aminoglycoside phosphotransferase (APT) family kinase protein